MSRNLVSVIIPTYKSSVTLKDAIDSVLNQTYEEIEVIVVDDNDPSTEFRKKTQAIMEIYKDNNKVIYVQHEKNKNGAAARNTGFNFSNGDLICFLDDDDFFKESKVEKQVNYLLKNKKFGAVYCWRYQNGRMVSYEKEGDLSEDLLSLSFAPYTSSIMMKRECYKFLEGFDESYKRHQDYEFLLRFFESYLIGVVKEPLLEIRSNQIDNTLHGQELEKLKNQFLGQFSKHINRINNTKPGFKKIVYARHYTGVFWSYLKRGRFIDCSRIFIIYTFNCGFTFWKNILRQLNSHLRIKINKMF